MAHFFGEKMRIQFLIYATSLRNCIDLFKDSLLPKMKYLNFCLLLFFVIQQGCPSKKDTVDKKTNL